MGNLLINNSASDILGRGFCGKKQHIKRGSKYSVLDFATGIIHKCNSSDEVSELIGLNRSNVSTYCRNKNVYNGRFRIELQGQEDWKTDMSKVKVLMKNI